MKKFGVLILVYFIIFSVNGIVSAQTEPGAIESLGSGQSDVQWLWGEVVSLDSQNKIIKIKYLDYDEEKEKEIEISVDKNTTYENINSFSEIKPKDTLSIDYIIGPDKRNIAKNISLENPEEEMSVPSEVFPQEEM